MNFRPFADGCWIVEAESIKDRRGCLAQTYDEKEFTGRGMHARWPIALQTTTRGCGAVRGMHWQVAPHAQAKLVRCIHGIVTDAIVDVRPASLTYGKPYTVDLSEENMRSLYIPEGFAHGFQCISEACVMLYSLTDIYDPRSARSFHCTDPAVRIPWPLPVMNLSEQDAAAPPLTHAVNHAY